MKYLLDTDICIYIIKKNPPSLAKKFQKLRPGDVAISSVTLAELQYGVAKSQYHEKNQAALNEFTLPLEIVPFDEHAAILYGVLRNQLEKNGMPIGPLDLLIAAHAKSLEMTLVTNNVKEFSRVEKLVVENWVA